MKPETSQFETANLAAAAFMVAGRHLKLLDVDASDRRRAVFVFEDPQGQGSELEADFLTGGALVPASEFHRQLRVLRRLIEERAANQNRSASQNSNSKGYKQREYNSIHRCRRG